MVYSTSLVMERSGLSEVEAANFINEIRNRTIEQGGKCVRVFHGGKLVKLIVGRVPTSKYKVK